MATSQVHHFLLPLLVLFSMLSAIQSGTWLSFNQNTGGIELADRLLGGRLGKSIADVVSSGELDPEKNAQLAGLLRMCRDRVKRSSSAVQPNMENLNDLCSALLQLTKEQRRKRKVSSRFVPVRMDEDLLWW